MELPEHAVILAEGLTVERYLDVGERANFDTGDTIRLVPDFSARLTPATASVWKMKGAAPLLTHGGKLRAVRAALARRTQVISRRRTGAL